MAEITDEENTPLKPFCGIFSLILFYACILINLHFIRTSIKFYSKLFLIILIKGKKKKNSNWPYRVNVCESLSKREILFKIHFYELSVSTFKSTRGETFSHACTEHTNEQTSVWETVQNTSQQQRCSASPKRVISIRHRAALMLTLRANDCN